MKNIIKSALVTAVAAALLLSFQAGASAAQVNRAAEPFTYKECIKTSGGPEISTLAGTSALSADFTVGSYEDLIETIAKQYLNRDQRFTVRYNATRYSIDSGVNDNDHFWDDVFSVDLPDTTSDLDYLRGNMVQMKLSGYYYGTYALLLFTQTYRTTKDEENYVDSAVGSILKKLDLDGVSQYKKIELIHNYILQNVDYDFSLSRFSAYSALHDGEAVCNGYALLMYKMLMEAGVPVRKIDGTGVTGGSSEAHAWNIAKIGQYWYNIDATWDDSGNKTQYFLKNNAAFSDHIRDSEFNTAAFNAKYPISPLNFDVSHDVTLVGAVAFPLPSGTYPVGESFTLRAVVSPADATDPTLRWTSSNPAVATVDGGGTVSVIAKGTAVITAVSEDGGGASASFALTAADGGTADPWAIDGVQALAARGIIPQALSSGYRTGITRAEFTALAVNVYEYARGAFAPNRVAPFADISVSPYAGQIAKGYALKLIDGVAEDTFMPDGSLTREQCAKIISSLAAAVNTAPDDAGGLSAGLPFGDQASISSWALPYVRYTYDNGLMNGSGGNFEPKSVLTREQAMLIAERLIEKYQW